MNKYIDLSKSLSQIRVIKTCWKDKTIVTHYANGEVSIEPDLKQGISLFPNSWIEDIQDRIDTNKPR